ncbi:MAG: FkbM family methyltransferase [Pseudomonadota bacterium]
MTLPVLVINRACDTGRLQKFKQRARLHGVKPQRIAALDGHRADCPFHLWADLIGPQFWGGDRIKPGALACYLSHRRAWTRVVEAGYPAALICEDDADLTEPPDRIAALAAETPDLDLMFANDRLAAGGAGTLSLEAALAAMTAQAPGADCYLITAQGARAMLERSAAQRIVAGVDWAMIWNGLPREAARVRPELQSLDAMLAQGAGAAPPLTVRVAGQPMAALRGGPSSIAHGLTVPIAALKTQAAKLVHADYAAQIGRGLTRLSFLGRSGADPVMEAHRSGTLWEEAALSALIRRLPEGARALDVGAHLGNHAIALARWAGAEVIAVEPNPEITRLLAMNIALNRVEGRVRIEPQALGAAQGTGTLAVHRRRPGQSSVTPGPAPAEAPPMRDDLPAFDTPATPRKQVEIVPGDDLLGETRIDALKIDTAGREMDVLRGLKKTLRRCHPLVLVDHGLADAERVAGFLDRCGLTLLERFAHDKGARQIGFFGPGSPVGQGSSVVPEKNP